MVNWTWSSRRCKSKLWHFRDQWTKMDGNGHISFRLQPQSQIIPLFRTLSSCWDYKTRNLKAKSDGSSSFTIEKKNIKEERKLLPLKCIKSMLSSVLIDMLQSTQFPDLRSPPSRWLSRSRRAFRLLFAMAHELSSPSTGISFSFMLSEHTAGSDWRGKGTGLRSHPPWGASQQSCNWSTVLGLHVSASLPYTVHGISCFLCFLPKFESFNTLMILTFVGYTCCESLLPIFSLCFKVSLDEQTFYILIYSYLSALY